MQAEHRQSAINSPKQPKGKTHLGLLALLLLLLRFSFRDGSQSLLCADGDGLVTLGGDGGKVSTDDTALVLHRPARALLGNFFRDALLVHPAVYLGPGDLAGILALEKERFIFGADEAEDLARIS